MTLEETSRADHEDQVDELLLEHAIINHDYIGLGLLKTNQHSALRRHERHYRVVKKRTFIKRYFSPILPMTPIHINVKSPDNACVRAERLSDNARFMMNKAFVKDLYRRFPELKSEDHIESLVVAEGVADFPQLYSRLNEQVISPLFDLNRYLKPREDETVQPALSFESAFIGPQLSNFVIVSPRAKPLDLVDRIQTYANMMLKGIVGTSLLDRSQTLADGYTLQTRVTQVPSKYVDRPQHLNPTLPISSIDGLEQGKRDTIITSQVKLWKESELYLEDLHASIPETLKAYRVDVAVRLLFK